MGDITEYWQKGVDLARQAVAEDTRGDYEKAANLYNNAVNCFAYVIKYSKNEKQKANIRQRAIEYDNRYKELKELLKQQAEEPNGTVGKKKTTTNNGDTDDDDADAKKLRSSLTGAILTEKPNVHWDDVAGLDGAKEAIKEAVILPIKFPHLFTGNRKPWRGILLYGPPGTGKSYLAKAVATEASSTFFSISSSDLVSKWLGESERLVKQLFDMAKENRPSIVFIDEIDSLFGARGDGDSEASRRIKTELLVQMNGVGNDLDGVLILGATNIPWQLDPAVRRRFEKRIYIPLPDAHARSKMFELNVGNTPCTLTSIDYKTLGQKTERYSGSDISTLVRDALLQPIRKVQAATHFKKVQAPSRKDEKVMKEYWTPCSPGDPDAVEMTWERVETEDLWEPELTMRDFLKAIQSSRPTVRGSDIEQHIQFTSDFGQEG